MKTSRLSSQTEIWQETSATSHEHKHKFWSFEKKKSKFWLFIGPFEKITKKPNHYLHLLSFNIMIENIFFKEPFSPCGKVWLIYTDYDFQGTVFLKLMGKKTVINKRAITKWQMIIMALMMHIFKKETYKYHNFHYVHPWKSFQSLTCELIFKCRINY